MNKFCSDCTKEMRLPLEERVHIALSRVPGENYNCPKCYKVHSLKKRVQAAVMPEKSIQNARTIAKPVKEKPKNDDPRMKQMTFTDLL